uniref:Uncharacterized protein n=1 Tax=Chaetoceros debilis TaxID=122233 RepID=A0A7S3Q1S6_9STRA|mmetsp:Transcript_5468/g.8145  ORF Transcript_5468/g.8145 Transcript_5468/m.8145 type:complete len:158 (+) Transcript_5468:440-913(+)
MRFFYQIGEYNNFILGETNPAQPGCTGNLSGKVQDMFISGLVAGQPLTKSDFIVDTSSTVPNLTFEIASDPHEEDHRKYQKYRNKNAYDGSGGVEIDVNGVNVLTFLQYQDRCQSDWSCECVVFSRSDSMCWKRSQCVDSEFDNGDGDYDVYMRQWE